MLNRFTFLCLLTLGFASTRAACAASNSYAAAMKLMDAKRWSEAKPLLERALREDPKDLFTAFNLGSVHFNLELFPPAISYFGMVAGKKGALGELASLCLVKCYRREKQFITAEKILRKLLDSATTLRHQIEVERDNLREATLLAALDEYDGGDYAYAVKLLDVAARLGAKEEGRLMQGLSLLRLRRNQEAKSVLSELTNSSDKELRDNAVFFLERADSPSESSPTWAFAELGLGYNSNAFLDSTTESPTGDPTSQLLISGGVRLPWGEPYFANIGYTFFWEEVYGLTAARFLSHSLRGQVGYQDSQWLVRVSPSLGYQQLADAPFLLKIAAGAEVQRHWGSFDTGAQMELAKNYAQTTDYRYLDGTLLGVRIFVDYSAGKSNYSFSYRLLSEAIGDLSDAGILIPQRNFGHGPAVRYSRRLAAAWQLQSSLSATFKSYPTLVLPGSFERRDQQYLFAVKGAYDVLKQLQLFATATLLLNRSSLNTATIDDKNYTQFLFLTGASWNLIN